MKKRIAITALSSLGLILATQALAQPPGMYPGMRPMPPYGMAPGGMPMTGGMPMMGQHSMSGTVTTIDKSKGTVSVKTDEGMLDVHFPPQSLSDIKEGDTVTVFLGLSKGKMEMPGGMGMPGGMSPGMQGGQSGGGMQAPGTSQGGEQK